MDDTQQRVSEAQRRCTGEGKAEEEVDELRKEKNSHLVVRTDSAFERKIKGESIFHRIG